VIGAALKAQLVLKLLARARCHRQLAQDDVAGNVVRVRLSLLARRLRDLGISGAPGSHGAGRAARSAGLRGGQSLPCPGQPLGRPGQGVARPLHVRLAHAVDGHPTQKLTETSPVFGSTPSGTASSSPAGRGPMPSLLLTLRSISSDRSGLSRRNWRAFSLPCPSWSPS